MAAGAPPAEVAPKSAHIPAENASSGVADENAMTRNASAVPDAKETLMNASDVEMTDAPAGSAPMLEAEESEQLSSAEQTATQSKISQAIAPELQADDRKTVTDIPQTVANAAETEFEPLKTDTSDANGLADVPKPDASPGTNTYSFATKQHSELSSESPAIAGSAEKAASMPDEETVGKGSPVVPILPSAAGTELRPPTTENFSEAEKASSPTETTAAETTKPTEQPTSGITSAAVEQPPTALEKPAKTAEEPEVPTDKPADAAIPPVPSTESSHQPPEKPVETTAKASDIPKAPIASMDKPVVLTEQPPAAEESSGGPSLTKSPSSSPDAERTPSTTPAVSVVPAGTVPTTTPSAATAPQFQKSTQSTPAVPIAASTSNKLVASSAPAPAGMTPVPRQPVSAAPVPRMIRIPMSGITTPKAGATTRPSTGGPPPPKRARVSGTLDAGGPSAGNRGNGADLSEATLQRYRQCAAEAGVRLIAKASQVIQVSGDARRHFLEDHSQYMREIGAEFKLRTIGGSKLDLYTLYVSVLERGGVQAVISSRTFRLVAKALDLPRSCTSAAYILRSDYEKMLYFYEQKHVWGRDPAQAPPLSVVDRNSRPSAVHPSPQLLRNTPRTASRGTPRAGNAPNTANATPASARPKRQAALAASSAVAAAAAAQQDELYESPDSTPRRTRTLGIDEMSLTPTEEAIVEEEVNANAPHTVYVPGAQGERERVIGALWSTVHDDVAFALGTLNALSFDPRNTFQARQFTGLLDALYEIMHRHLEDVLCARTFSLPAGAEQTDPAAPRIAPMSAVDIADAGHVGEAPGIGVSGDTRHDGVLRSSSLQQYGNLFNVVDSVAVDREQCAVVAVNILRNMSFSDRNAIFLSESQQILELSAEMILTVKVPANLRDGLMDMWINVSPYLNVSKGYPGHVVLTTCIKLLDPFLEGADFSRFTNCGEVLARLAASPERNEDAFVAEFNELLPRLVDMLGGKDRRYINAGLAALCNCSAFDWPARSRIARVPRAMPRLVNMLADPELAPRAALTLLNLAEAPSNRSVLLAYEKQLVEQAIKRTPAADTVASVLFDLSND